MVLVKKTTDRAFSNPNEAQKFWPPELQYARVETERVKKGEARPALRKY